MNEQELRELVRESIARHRGGGDATAGQSPDAARVAQQTAAFVRFPLVRGGNDDGMCLIEPAVRCNHCGYCQSYGH